MKVAALHNETLGRDSMDDAALARFPWRWMALLGLAAYGLFLLVWLPASLLWGQVAEEWPEASLDTAGATVWAGDARPARVAGHELSVSWAFDPSALLAARLGSRTTLTGDGLAWTGRIAWRSDDDWALTEARADLVVARLPIWLGQPLPPMFTPLGGEATLTFDRLDIREGWPTGIEAGQLAFRDLALGSLALGDWRGEVILDRDGAFAVALVPLGERLAGTLDARLTRQGWSIRLALKPGAAAPENLSGVLPLLGARNAQGFYEANFEGQWP